MTKSEIYNVAIAQSAIDLSARPEDFLSDENVVVLSKKNPKARKYLELPFSSEIVSYGSNAVASVSPEMRDITEDYLSKYPTEHLFETPHLHVLNSALIERGHKICFMAEYFLPDHDAVRTAARAAHIPYEIRILDSADFGELYLPEWSNALCEKRRELDMLGVGAYDGGRLIGLAGASADCETMWQIGIDVLPQYRRMGIAGALTSRLALEIFERGKVPFYCAAWCNLGSVRNALHSGFRPAWVEMTAKPIATVDEMNI